MPVGSEKEKAIELAVSSIEKAFGKGSIMRLGNEEALVKDVQAVLEHFGDLEVVEPTLPAVRKFLERT